MGLAGQEAICLCVEDDPAAYMPCPGGNEDSRLWRSMDGRSMGACVGNVWAYGRGAKVRGL